MTRDLDLRLAELLASRLCHDLVGPVGAIGNGMELLSEPDFGLDDEALALVQTSVEQVSTRLQYLRLAYGQAGAHLGEPGELRRLAEAYLAQHKAALDWPGGALELPDGAARLLLNMLALAGEALPRGGRVELFATPGAEGFQMSVVAEGREANLRAATWQALDPDVDPATLTPRNVHGFFARRLAEHQGGFLRVEREGAERVTIACLLPG